MQKLCVPIDIFFIKRSFLRHEWRTQNRFEGITEVPTQYFRVTASKKKHLANKYREIHDGEEQSRM